MNITKISENDSDYKQKTSCYNTKAKFSKKKTHNWQTFQHRNMYVHPTKKGTQNKILLKHVNSTPNNVAAESQKN